MVNGNIPAAGLPDPLPDLVIRQLRGVTGALETGRELLAVVMPQLTAHVQGRDYPKTINARWLALDFQDAFRGDPAYAHLLLRDYIQVARAGCALLGYTYNWGSHNSMIVARNPAPVHPVVPLETAVAQFSRLVAAKSD